MDDAGRQSGPGRRHLHGRHALSELLRRNAVARRLLDRGERTARWQVDRGWRRRRDLQRDADEDARGRAAQAAGEADQARLTSALARYRLAENSPSADFRLARARTLTAGLKTRRYRFSRGGPSGPPALNQ